MGVLRVIVQNLWGFDTFILLFAAFNALVLREAFRLSGELYGRLHEQVVKPLTRRGAEELRYVDREAAVLLRERAERLYALFVNFTAIFPLLGILGTVISLIPMVEDLGNMQSNFFEALTSTFWGLVFSVAFKVADGFLAAKMDDNDRNVTLLLQQSCGQEEALR